MPGHSESNDHGPSVAGIILAGAFPWANSAFDRISTRPLIPIAHRPLFSYALSWLRAGNVESLFVCGNRETREVENLMSRLSNQMHFTYLEDRMPRGAAGCVGDAGSLCNNETLVVADGTAIPTVDLARLLHAHQKSGATATIVVSAQSDVGAASAPRYRPAGVYVFDRKVLASIPDRGFCDIKEHLIPKLIRAGQRVMTFTTDGAVPRVLNEHTYLAVNEFVVRTLVSAVTPLNGYERRGHALIHTEARVDDDATLIGPLLVGPGARILSRAVLVGPATIGRQVTVGPGALVVRSAVWRRSTIHADAVVDRSIVADDVVIAHRQHHKHQIVVPMKNTWRQSSTSVTLF
jgi:NDP-sugar pyrophosphorylase family protein